MGRAAVGWKGLEPLAGSAWVRGVNCHRQQYTSVIPDWATASWAAWRPFPGCRGTVECADVIHRRFWESVTLKSCLAVVFLSSLQQKTCCALFL